jgi:hypothetical protein
MDNLVDAPDSAVEAFRSAANRLVEVLRDQFADGQVEALYSLQTAAAEVRRTSAQATEAGERAAAAVRDLSEKVAGEVAAGLAEFRAGGEGMVRALDDKLAAKQSTTARKLEAAAEQMTTHASEAVAAADAMAALLSGFADRVADAVFDGVRSLISEATTHIGEQLAAEVDASSAELRGAALDHAQAVTSQLEATSSQLGSLFGEAATRADEARAGLESVSGALVKHRVASEAALTHAGDTLTTRLREAAVAAQEQLRSAALAAVEEIRAGVQVALSETARAREEMTAVLVDARRAAEEELVVLRKQVQAAERREESVAERLQLQVDELVARTDTTVGQSLTHLRLVADALLERDAGLEKRRADEFARVLETVLKEGGASTRKLRDRIFRGMSAAQQATPAPAPTAAPEPPEPPAPKGTAPQPKRNPPAKPRATQAPTEKPVAAAPRKRAPAKKTTAPAEPAAEATAQENRPVQEEQA